MKRLLPAAAVLAIASGCAPAPISTPLPPAADVEAATEPKPVPPLEILDSEEASLLYDNAIEAHGERVRAAAVRVCLWLNLNGGKYDCNG